MATVHELFENMYSNKNGTTGQSEWVYASAGDLLAKANIFQQLDTALVLSQHYDKVHAEELASGDHTSFEAIRLFHALHKLYDGLADALVLVGAFELYAKAVLLRQGYLVHEVAGDEALRKLQKKQPVHRFKYRAIRKLNTAVHAGAHTLAISLFFKEAYRQKLKLSAMTIDRFEKLTQFRNKVHFNALTGYALATADLEAILELHQAICSAVRPRLAKRFRCNR